MRECLAFFLAQDYPAKRMFILNNHPVPLCCNVPGVTIFNEPSAEPGIPRNRLLAKIGEEFEFVHTWDDDDAWLPWHLRQAVLQISKTQRKIVAWKPARSWIHYLKSDEYQLNGNNYEASMIVYRSFMQVIKYATASGNEHRPLLDALNADKTLATTELGPRSSYIYTWRGDWSHASASLARDMRAGINPAQTLAERDAAWRKLQTDPGDGNTPLTPADIRPRYKDLLAHCHAALGEYEVSILAASLRPFLEAKP
jgi:hypothetical protein